MRASMTAKTIRMTVACPFCHCPYTFRSEQKLAEFNAKEFKRPLHSECRKAAIDWELRKGE